MQAMADVIVAICCVCAVALWGYATWWLLLAISAIAETYRRGIPFNLGVWAAVFPTGVWAMAACLLAKVARSNIFRYLGCVAVAGHVLLWLVISVLSVQRAAAGLLQHPPNLAEQGGDDDGAPERVRSQLDRQLSEVLLGGGGLEPGSRC